MIRWIFGIGRNIGRYSVEQSELWVIYDGLQLAWSSKWNNIIVESDCALVVKAINGRLQEQINRGLILRIQEFCKIQQVSREVNTATHTLARLKELPSEIADQIRNYGQNLAL